MALTEAQQFVLGKVGSRAKFSVANKTDIPKILLIQLGAAGVGGGITLLRSTEKAFPSL